MDPANQNQQNDISDKLKNLTLNTSAKDYVPKTKIIEQKLQLNLNAEEYKPKNLNNNVYQEGHFSVKLEDEDNEELEDEELDMIVNDLVENDAYEEFEEEESDDEKWFPNYSNCECCKGYIYKCKGSACINMGVCYCKMKDECDEDNY
jgi:hypothetical protein